MAVEREPHERLAVLEHRADKNDQMLERIEGWMKEMTALQSELVRIQTERIADNSRIDRLEAKIDSVDRQRAKQHEQTQRWAQADRGLTDTNASWLTWFRTLVITLIAAGFSSLLAIRVVSGA